MPASRRIVETRDQGPDPCSSQQARKDCLFHWFFICVGDFVFASPPCLTAPKRATFEVGTSVENFTQQKLQLTLRMHLSKNVLRTTAETCGADRDRTDDIQLAKLALSQLSYSPDCRVGATACLPPVRENGGPRWT
jgi:hypothetical protein